jgi:NAD(P)-dependent dehydrogenase (short-subunit alcohol dehydrogenase family)
MDTQMDLPRTPSFRLETKRALVAGASSGIGLAASVALGEAGAHVVLAARSLDKLNAIVGQMTKQGMSAEALQLDVSNIEKMEADISSQSSFDILVNSAGLARHTKAVDTDLYDYDAVMNLNLRGAYFLTRTVAKGLLEAGKPGSLMNITSQMGHVGGIERAVYCASKFGVEGFTKAMAIEFGQDAIRINSIAPTFIRTPLGAVTLQDPEKRKWIEDKIKLNRVGEVEDIMGAVTFLASDASALVTGISLLIDGGWTAD